VRKQRGQTEIEDCVSIERERKSRAPKIFANVFDPAASGERVYVQKVSDQ
jgi:hypothetical protein